MVSLPATPVESGDSAAPLPVSFWVGAAAIFAATVAGEIIGGDTGASIGNFALLAGFAAAGVLFVVRARRLGGPEQPAWTTIGVGFLVAVSGVALIAALVLLTGDAPAFGPSDLFFFAGYLIALTGFASLPHAGGSRWYRTRVALDALVGAVSLGTLVWVLILAPLAPRLEEAPMWERIIGSLFPFLDVAVFVALMIVVVRRSGYRFDIRVVLFGVGIVFHVTADILYLISGVGRSFSEADPNFVLYGFAAIAYLATALMLDRVPRPREYAQRRTPLWAMVLPYSTAVVMAAVLVGRVGPTALDATEHLLLIAALVVVVLVVARQGIAIKENRHMLEEQRSVLVSSISHELRTPLTSLVGFLDLLARSETLDAGERQELLEIVLGEANYMARIVSDLVMLSRGDVGELTLDVTRCDVEAIIESALTTCGMDRSSVEVDVEPGVEAFVDADRIEQAVVNLLTNAARYGGPHCIVRARVEGGDDLVVEVHDDGAGVPKRYEFDVWERFERGPHRYDAGVPGSGIGLSIVQAVAAAHGGEATYRISELLGGACFTIALPGRVAAATATAPEGSTDLAVGRRSA